MFEIANCILPELKFAVQMAHQLDENFIEHLLYLDRNQWRYYVCPQRVIRIGANQALPCAVFSVSQGLSFLYSRLAKHLALVLHPIRDTSESREAIRPYCGVYGSKKTKV